MKKALLSPRAIAAVLIFATPVMAGAQEASAPETAAETEASPHEAAFNALSGGLDHEAVLTVMLQGIRKQLLQNDAGFAAAEKLYPGFADVVTEAMRPALGEHYRYTQDVMRPKAIAMMREMFSDAEATQLAEFYRSPLGRRILLGASNNFTVESVASDAIAEEEISEKSVARDMNALGARTIGSLSREDVLELSAYTLANKELFRKLDEFTQRMVPIRAEAENLPMDPKLDARAKAAVGEAVKAHIAKFEDAS